MHGRHQPQIIVRQRCSRLWAFFFGGAGKGAWQGGGQRSRQSSTSCQFNSLFSAFFQQCVSWVHCKGEAQKKSRFSRDFLGGGGGLILSGEPVSRNSGTRPSKLNNIADLQTPLVNPPVFAMPLVHDKNIVDRWSEHGGKVCGIWVQC